ncbi:aspartate/glutamate racemase family protein [Aliikangiella marina]|uniref:Aspartate/glutamate racemase family protein n=1 Tax=Aliikangiella marina TaxID=1712262 RepID=A0A545THS4_9GAMM|nr:aspartate/glutamate racemase family protein [Aliikangiella marina]TQV76762.1 aspartate/glutamate racemase family protein [Aliikangiella marina]
MKTIGLIGGMSWESTVSYYQLINRGIKQHLGGLHSAKLLMYSVDFAEIEALQHAGDWQKTAEILASAAQSLESGGADCVVICTNTMHKVAPQVAASVSLPLIHIADATGQKLSENSIETVGLLGTNFTMEQSFYKGRIESEFGIQVVIPNQAERKIVHEVIYQELCLGKIEEASKREYLKIIDKLAAQGAQAVILGCTEIALLVEQADTNVPLYNTTEIHAQAAIEFALSV